MKGQNEDIKLTDIIKIMWQGKLILLAFVFVFSAVSVFIALSLPNVYKSSSLTAPVSSADGQGGLGALAGQFGGIASLAGINLGAGNSNVDTAMQILESRQFIMQFIEKYDLLIPIMAAKDYDLKTKQFEIDEDVYDEERERWVREVRYPRLPEPSLLEAQEEFLEDLSVRKDDETGFVTISFDSYSPDFAQQVVENLITEVNNAVRDRDKREAIQSIEFLTTKLKEEQLSEHRTLLFELLAEQTRTLMFSESRQHYVLDIIDPPVAPEIKSKPSRALICVIGALFGGAMGLAFLLIMYFRHE